MPPQLENLVERDQELARFDALVRAAASGNGACALVHGEAGVGKTTLIRAALRGAEASGMHVLWARGGELERDFPYGVVRQLFEGPLMAADAAERASLLEGAAGLAAPVLGFEPQGMSATAMDAPFAAVHGLYWLAAGLAATQPLVLAIDDLHWADAPSLRWLSYLVRRLEGVPLLVIAASRAGEPDPTGIIAGLEQEPLVSVMRPSSLSPAGVAEIVTSSSAAAMPEFCAACHRITAGNPFYLRELLDAAARAEIPPTAAGADRVDSLGPANVAVAVLTRMRQHGPRAEALARALAVLDADASLRGAAELAGVGKPAAAAELIDQLISAQILSAERSFQFVHPVVRTAVYQAIPPGERLRLHGAAFALLADDGAAPDRLARHLLVVEPGNDPRVVQTLRAAAAQAQTRGAPDLAARYLQRALAEARDPADRAAITHDLGNALLADRDPAWSEHLRRATELADDPATREAWTLELTRALAVAGRPVEAAEFATAALAEGITDPALAVRVESELLSMAWLMPSASPEGIVRLEQLEQTDVPAELQPLVVVHRALRITSEGGPAADAMRLADQAINGGVLLEERSSVPFVALATLIWNDDLERPRQLCNAALALAQQMGSQHLMVNGGAFGGLAALRAGRLAEAAGAAGLSYRFARDSAMPDSIDWAWALSTLLDSMRERGEIEAAQALLQAADAEGELPGHVTFVFLLESRGRLRCAQGRLREGADDLLESGRRWEPFGLLNPNVSAWRSDAAFALLHLGERDQAVQLADEELGLARTAGTARGIGVACRAGGIVHRDDELLAEATEVLAGSPARLEYAKAMCELGASGRRAGRRREVRELLLAALDLARRCTAAPLSERIRSELSAIGTRPRRDYLGGVGALTPGELRIARMAAEGRTNKDIAQALFVTLRTVETHLTHVYRKLDIESRAALSGALEGTPVAA
ncbi:MAG TPA: AAA family ATPase [Solirubrobacteraceae bacterium]|jgi:DNA-binding CsgD family transcriptional regulator